MAHGRRASSALAWMRHTPRALGERTHTHTLFLGRTTYTDAVDFPESRRLAHAHAMHARPTKKVAVQTRVRSTNHQPPRGQEPSKSASPQRQPRGQGQIGPARRHRIPPTQPTSSASTGKQTQTRPAQESRRHHPQGRTPKPNGRDHRQPPETKRLRTRANASERGAQPEAEPPQHTTPGRRPNRQRSHPSPATSHQPAQHHHKAKQHRTVPAILAVPKHPWVSCQNHRSKSPIMQSPHQPVDCHPKPVEARHACRAAHLCAMPHFPDHRECGACTPAASAAD